MTQMERVCREAGDFDILHSHLDYWMFSLLARIGHAVRSPRCTAGSICRKYAAMYELTQAPVVSISDAQRKPLPNANFVRTVITACR